MQALAESRGGGGNDDSILTALRPQLRKRHSIKTHSGNTDWKQIELIGEHTTLYQTNTQKNPLKNFRKKGTAMTDISDRETILFWSKSLKTGSHFNLKRPLASELINVH